MNLETTLPRTAALACSREGAAIGEGIAMLLGVVLAAVVVVYLVAVISAIVVGRRKGRVGRQLLVHLASATAVLVAAPIVIWGLAVVWSAFTDIRVRRDNAAAEAWLAPLKNPATGELDSALKAVLDADDAFKPGRVSYLILALRERFDAIETPLDADDRAAALAAAARLRQANDHSEMPSHPSNLDHLDAAVAWLIARPDLPGALRSCTARTECVIGVLGAADNWCYRHRQTCREAFDAASLDAAEALARGDARQIYRMQSIRGRVKPLLPQ